ncbi:MAG: peptidase M19, partial [Arenibacter algicola]|nr:peptidase M19 [Arenibacter algicola]
MKKILRYTLAIVLLLYFLATFIVSPILDKRMNLVEYSDPRQLETEAQELYNSLEFIADLHCDALLWDRDLTKQLDYAHLDFPRMQQANMSLQAFTIVTKSPKGQNFKQNSADAFDEITMLNFVQGRLPDKWFSLYRRAEYQARALQDYQKKFAGKFLLVKSREDLKKLIALKKTDPEVIGGF